MSTTPAAPQRITVYPANGAANKKPAMLVLPGGGYGIHADHEGHDYAVWLNSLGFHAFVLNYALAPHRYPDALIEAGAAMDWIRSDDHGLAVDTSRVGVIGSSAGGHLAASLSVNSIGGSPSRTGSRPNFAVLCYPLISFVHDVHDASAMNLLGTDASAELRHAVSADEHVDGETPPTFIWFTADDESVNVSHGLRYAAALAKQAIPFELHVFQHGSHGLGLASKQADVKQWVSLCENWLQTAGATG